MHTRTCIGAKVLKYAVGALILPGVVKDASTPCCRRLLFQHIVDELAAFGMEQWPVNNGTSLVALCLTLLADLSHSSCTCGIENLKNAILHTHQVEF